MQITCPNCKIAMNRIDRLDNPDMDTYICKGCGTKKSFPKKSAQKILREDNVPKLDKDRASSEGIMMHDEEKPKPVVKKQKHFPEEKTIAFEEKDPIKEESKPQDKEIKLLKDELNQSRADLEIKNLEKEGILKNFKSFSAEYSKALFELKTTLTAKIEEIEKLFSNFEKRMK